MITLEGICLNSKIAKVFLDLDEEIALLAHKANALQQQKLGLMQKLLTGDVRVKV